MPLLSDFARTKKISFFLKSIPKTAKILEIGSGQGWVGDYLRQGGWSFYQGLDLVSPADIVGDIRQWKSLGMEQQFYDVILAFEVVERVDCFDACRSLLKPGGKLMMTTPVPSMDWFMQILETVGLNQKRTSPHSHLVDLKTVPGFKDRKIKYVAGLSQWAVFTK